METKKKEKAPEDFAQSGPIKEEEESQRKTDSQKEPALGGLWQDWLPYGHGAFLLFLVIDSAFGLRVTL